MKTLILILIVLMAAPAFTETEITWKSPEADFHYVEINKLVWFEGQYPVYAGEVILSEDRFVSVDLEEGTYMIQIQSCLGAVCMEKSEPFYEEVIIPTTAYDIQVEVLP